MSLPTLRDEITLVLKQSPGGAGFSFVSPVAFQQVIRRIADRFLQRGILDMDCAWWWECLRGECYGYAPADTIGVVKSLLKDDEEYWFIASEEHSGTKWLCEAKGSSIVEVLREMHHFEYYIVEKKLKWLLGENHHGDLFAAGDEMPKRLANKVV
jgi:hypothetical protein